MNIMTVEAVISTATKFGFLKVKAGAGLSLESPHGKITIWRHRGLTVHGAQWYSPEFAATDDARVGLVAAQSTARSWVNEFSTPEPSELEAKLAIEEYLEDR